MRPLNRSRASSASCACHSDPPLDSRPPPSPACSSSHRVKQTLRVSPPVACFDVCRLSVDRGRKGDRHTEKGRDVIKTGRPEQEAASQESARGRATGFPPPQRFCLWSGCRAEMSAQEANEQAQGQGQSRVPTPGKERTRKERIETRRCSRPPKSSKSIA